MYPSEIKAGSRFLLEGIFSHVHISYTNSRKLHSCQHRSGANYSPGTTQLEMTSCPLAPNFLLGKIKDLLGRNCSGRAVAAM